MDFFRDNSETLFVMFEASSIDYFTDEWSQSGRSLGTKYRCLGIAFDRFFDDRLSDNSCVFSDVRYRGSRGWYRLKPHSSAIFKNKMPDIAELFTKDRKRHDEMQWCRNLGVSSSPLPPFPLEFSDRWWVFMVDVTRGLSKFWCAYCPNIIYKLNNGFFFNFCVRS